MTETLAETPPPDGFEPPLEPVGPDPPQAVIPKAHSTNPTSRRMGVPSCALGSDYLPDLLIPQGGFICPGGDSTAGAGTPRSLVATPRGTPGRWGSAVPARSRWPGAAIPRAPATHRCAPPAAAGARRRFAWPARPPV